MKKIFLCFLCLIILSTIPCSVFAEDIQTGNESTAIETGAESAISASTEHFTSTEQNEEGADKLLSVKFKEWVVPHLEEISVIITLIGTLFYQIRKNKALGKTLGTMNNNAVSIAQNSSDMMSQALLNMQNASGAVTAYDARIAAMLEAYRLMAEDRARLEQEILEMKAYLKTAAESNLEFSNELAELLNLANIPNFKKEEIGARHLAAVKSIKEAESEALNAVQAGCEEVADHVGEET